MEKRLSFNGKLLWVVVSTAAHPLDGSRYPELPIYLADCNAPIDQTTFSRYLTMNDLKEYQGMQYDDQSVNSTETSAIITNELMNIPIGRIDGKIVEIMESWPIQLKVKTDDSSLMLELDESTIVEAGTRSVSVAELNSGDRVSLYIESDSENGSGYRITKIVIK